MGIQLFIYAAMATLAGFHDEMTITAACLVSMAILIGADHLKR